MQAACTPGSATVRVCQRNGVFAGLGSAERAGEPLHRESLFDYAVVLRGDVAITARAGYVILVHNMKFIVLQLV